MKFQKIVLKNGLTILFEKRDVQVTTVMLAAKFGSLYESEKEKGIAHFIEHLCFKATKKRNAQQIAFELEKVGGILNAFTSEEETAYHVKLPSNHLELAMDVIFDIFFNPIFPEEEIKKEANVICEEINMYHDNPRAHVVDKIKSTLFSGSYGMSIAGTQENVRAMTRKQLMEKHAKYYCPRNAILSVVGNNSLAEIIKFAEKFSVERDFKEKLNVNINKITTQETEKRENLQQANLCIGFHFPKLSEEERYVAELFSAILGEGMSSKLFTEVREKRGLAYAVKTDIDSGRDYSYFFIYIGTDKEKVEAVIKICVEEFHKMAKITEQELEDGKKQLIGNGKVESEDSANTAVNLILEEIAGKAEKYYEYETKINKVSLQDIKKFAEKTEYSYYVLSP